MISTLEELTSKKEARMADGNDEVGSEAPSEPWSHANLHERMRDRIKQASVMCGDPADAPGVEDVMNALKAEQALSDAVDRRVARGSGLIVGGRSQTGSERTSGANADRGTLAILDRLGGLREAVVDVQLRTERTEGALNRSRDLGEDLRAASKEALQYNERLADRARQLEEGVSSLRQDSATKTEVGAMERRIGELCTNREQTTSDLKTVVEDGFRRLESTFENGAKRSILTALGILVPSVLVALALLLHFVLGGG